ncbi:MAG TPA: SurA N-terminal domain-containing protein [Devosia sp.]
MVRTLGAFLLGLAILAGTALPALAAVKASVNGVSITDIQVSQRLKLFQLEGKSGAKAALDELVNEQVMIQEAKRLGITVSDAQVEDAVLQVARNIKVSRDKLGQILNQQGVNIDTLKDRLHATLAWNQVVQSAVMSRVQMSDAELDQKAQAELNGSNSFDYILKEVIFIGKGSSARTGQANQYRKSFQGCDSAVQLSLSYTDAAVIDVGRRHATQMPEAIAKELAGLNVGGITKPRVVEQGVSMLAVCSKSEAKDTTFIKNTIQQQAGDDALKAEAKKYLEEVKQRMKIVYE